MDSLENLANADLGLSAMSPDLRKKAKAWECSILDKKFALKMDEDIKHLRSLFHYPKNSDLPKTDPECCDMTDDCVYFCGHSLGLQPKATRAKIDRELDKWATRGAYGHTDGVMPWARCDECVDEQMAQLVGAKREEVCLMNGLTVNLHLLLLSFYRPTDKRYKILLESRSFPSDHYAIESQIKLHGLDPKKCMVVMEPRPDEETLRTEDILQLLKEEGESIAVVMFSGVQYYTGQLFEMETITKAGQAQGCYVGWDLAHAVGNVEIELHKWGVDFACWCTYKYCNTGAGGIAGFFIHEKLFEECKKYPRLSGWWSHKKSTRFDMTNELDCSEGAKGFRISNPPVLLCAPLEASLQVFGETSMKDLRARSKLLTGYLEYLLNHYYNKSTSEDSKDKDVYVDILTPDDPDQRGAQLSVTFSVPVNKVHQELQTRGVVCDKREPSVLRLTPVPLYNTFLDVYKFVEILGEALRQAGV